MPAGVQRCSVSVGVCSSDRQIKSKLPAISTTCYFSSVFLDGFDSAFFPPTELESKMLSCPLAISASFHSSSLAPLSLPFTLHQVLPPPFPGSSQQRHFTHQYYLLSLTPSQFAHFELL